MNDELDSRKGTRDTGWELLPGLPPYGEPAQSFSATGMGSHSEGLVVRFRLVDGSTWTGNFQRGFGNAEGILPHPNGHEVVVLAGGTAYVVDPDKRQLLQTFRGDIEFAEQQPDSTNLILGNGLGFECMRSGGPGWRSRRMSWEGMRNVAFISGDRLSGEGYSPLNDGWHSFIVDLKSGHVTGGSYDGPDTKG